MRRNRQALLVLATFLLAAIILFGTWLRAGADDSPSWLANAAPSLSKTTDLSSAPLPTDQNNNVDCQPETFLPNGQTTPQTVCTFLSPLGTLTADGRLDTGANTFASLEASGSHSYFIPTVDSSVAFASLTSPGIGNYVGVYRHLTKADLHQSVSAAGVSYDVPAEPDAFINDPATGSPLEIDVPSITFSSNGQWLVANLPHRGLIRVNTSDLSVELFARPMEPSWFLGLATPSLAVSDDGRYVAANTDLFGTGNLNVYDVSTCTDQSTAVTNQQQYCAGKDIWHGQTLDGQLMGDGLLSVRSDLQRPTHIRFVDDSNVSFSAQYSVTSATDYKAATYVATAVGGTQHKLGLLGLGDSYISGQGAFDYRDGTDTSNNACHLSELSYPFLLGNQNFNAYNSVACSGALTRNVSSIVDSKATEKTYQGQVNDKIKEEERDKQNILTNFLPGYIYQQEFASTYLPQAMLLSVGGDDVGFADIVKSCVASVGTCYDTYEDRAELANEIDNIYPKLVATYTTLRQQSGGGRLYVVGYPQIAQPGGSCGLNVHLNDAEVTFSTRLVSYLDSVIQKAAATAGVSYVDTQQAFDGHKLCETGDKAINGLTAGNDVSVGVFGKSFNVIGAESYHPTPLGYQLLAQAIARQTTNETMVMPKPTTFDQPPLDTAAPLLQNLPKTGRSLKTIIYDGAMTADTTLRGDSDTVAIGGAEAQLKPESKYQVVLHSTPILLDEGGVDAAGNITTTIHFPAATEPGFHTLHIYATDIAGNDVDVQKVIYIAASATDYDGDGLLNAHNPCLIVSPSGQDTDHDGLDDACDPDISTAPQPAATVSGIVAAGVSSGAVSGSAGTTAETVMAVPNNTALTADASSDILGAIIPPKAAPSLPQPALNKTVKLYRVNWVSVLWLLAGVASAITSVRKVLYHHKR